MCKPGIAARAIIVGAFALPRYRQAKVPRYPQIKPVGVDPALPAMSAFRCAFLHVVLILVALCAASSPMAAPAAHHRTLFDLLRLSDLVSVMRDEGLVEGEDLAADLFPSGGNAGWARAVDRIYEEAAMGRALADGLSRSLPAEHLAPLVRFFGSDLGRRIVSSEIEARRAFLDPDIEAAARERSDAMPSDDTRRRLVERFIAANDLVSFNVAGAMNANLAFYEGLAEAGGDGFASERDRLEQVWSQEASIRADTEAWLTAYLTVAYAPLSDADLDAYVALSQSPAGQALNAALFDGFDAMYEDISRNLGRAVAGALTGIDI